MEETREERQVLCPLMTRAGGIMVMCVRASCGLWVAREEGGACALVVLAGCAPSGEVRDG